MRGRALSLLVVAAVVGVAGAAVLDTIRGGETRVTAPVAARQPPDCLDGGACLRNLRALVGFFRDCVGSWNDAANRANRAAVVEGGFDEATLFRSGRGRCSLHFVSSESARVLLANRIGSRWVAAGGGRRPPAADDFVNAWAVDVRPDGTLSLRGG